jgi:hypothetical protein
MLGVVLLYVGVVLIVNGIWLVGQARAAAMAARMPAMETTAVGSTIRGGGVYAGEAAAGQELGGEVVAVRPPIGEDHPLFIQNHEVAILNIFTGIIGFAIAIIFIVLGGSARIPALGLGNIQAGGAILLFAWFAWAVLWGLFFALLTLQLPIARLTGYVAIIEGIGTSWALALALLWGKLAITLPPPH